MRNTVLIGVTERYGVPQSALNQSKGVPQSANGVGQSAKGVGQSA